MLLLISFMKKSIAYCLSIFSIFVYCTATNVHAQVFVCKQGDVIEYTNSKKNKSCEAVKADGVSYVSSSSFSKPKIITPTTDRKNNDKAERPSKPSNAPPVPDAFKSNSTASTAPLPNIANMSEKDKDRHIILSNELKVEQRKADELKKTYNNGQPERLGDEKNYQKYLDRTEQLRKELIRTQSNIEALTHELKVR